MSNTFENYATGLTEAKESGQSSSFFKLEPQDVGSFLAMIPELQARVGCRINQLATNKCAFKVVY
jgi:hypothetical protein